MGWPLRYSKAVKSWVGPFREKLSAKLLMHLLELNWGWNLQIALVVIVDAPLYFSGRYQSSV